MQRSQETARATTCPVSTTATLPATVAASTARPCVRASPRPELVACDQAANHYSRPDPVAVTPSLTPATSPGHYLAWFVANSHVFREASRCPFAQKGESIHKPFGHHCLQSRDVPGQSSRSSRKSTNVTDIILDTFARSRRSASISAYIPIVDGHARRSSGGTAPFLPTVSHARRVVAFNAGRGHVLRCSHSPTGNGERAGCCWAP